MPRFSSLRDFARFLELSPATVSLALRGVGRIGPATRQRVLDEARQHRFTVDSELSRVATHRFREIPDIHGNILFVSTRRPKTPVMHPIRGRIIDGARQRALQRGFRLDVVSINDSDHCRVLGSLLRDQGINGVILSQLFDRHLIEDIDWSRCSVVAVNVGYVEPPFHQVRLNWRLVLSDLWVRLTAMGYRRIGLVLPDEPEAVDLREKMAAVLYHQELKTAPRDRVPVAVVPIEQPDRFVAWFRRERPDVVVGFTDAVYYWMEAAGIRVPEEASFVSLSWGPGQPKSVSIAGVETVHETSGMRAFDLLESLIGIGERGVPEVTHILVLPGELRAGSSLPPSLDPQQTDWRKA